VSPPSGTSGGALSLRALSKSFGEVLALQPTELDIEAGQFVTLLGPSGCGKTTLLRIVAGLEQPSGGRVLLDEIDITSLPPERRPVNLVFQRYALFPHLDVRENIAYGLRAARLDRAELSWRVSEAVETMGLAQLAARSISELSGGQAQRVALARALVNRPRVLLLDEPLAALDLKLRKQMQLELRSIHATYRTTFLYVTHDQSEALVMSDRIVVMNDGRIDQIGTPEEVYRRPRTAFVAGFVGESSSLEGTLIELHGERARIRLDAAGGDEVTVRHALEGAASGGPVTVIVRPEALTLTETEPVLRGRLVDSWFLGDHYGAEVQLMGERRLRINLPAGADVPETGSEVELAWDDDLVIAVPAQRGS
jgi:spermidine/putrescine transport system ATP-binding protein